MSKYDLSIAGSAEPITPSNAIDNPFSYRAIYVGGAGDITLVTHNQQVVTFKAVPQGSILPVGCQRVNSTGTTATLLVGLV